MFWCWLWVALAADRVEFPVAVHDEVKVVPAGEDGLVLFVQRKGEKKTYEILGYDTQFETKWTSSHEVGKQQVETAWDADGDHTWVLLQRGFKKVNLLKTNLDTGYTRLRYPPPLGQPDRSSQAFKRCRLAQRSCACC